MQRSLMLVITLTYAVLQPVIVLAGLLTFSTNWFVYRYLTMFVYFPVFESGGKTIPMFYPFASASCETER